MNVNLWVGLATLLSATFFLAGYLILVLYTYEHNKNGLYVSILYLIGAFFFFLYGVFVMYRAAKYPVPSYITI